MRFDKKGLLIVYSGPSGVGKGTVRKRVFEKNGDKLYYSISKTTRNIREGEKDGKDYFFVSKEEFLKEIERDNFLEYNEYVGNFYGTPKDIVLDKINKGIDVVLEIEVNGAMQIKKKMPDCVMIFIAPPSIDGLRSRLVGRNTDSMDVIEKRLKRAVEEIGFAQNYDYIVVNNDNSIDEAADEIISIIESSHHKANHAVDDYYKMIGYKN